MAIDFITNRAAFKPLQKRLIGRYAKTILRRFCGAIPVEDIFREAIGLSVSTSLSGPGKGSKVASPHPLG
jgi:hypothetical protein